MTGLLDALVGDGTAAALLLAFVLGTLVGAERAWRRHAAGLRTCSTVAIASAAFADLMVTRVDPSNLGAGFGAIATGVGFLGAGMIFREGESVKGLTTAATIWAVAAVGALCGAREPVAAIMLAVLVVGAHLILRPVARWIDHRKPPKAGPEPT